MSEFRTMSLPSVMLFVSMKMSSGVAAVAGRQRPLHCAATLGRSADGSPSFVMLTGGDLRGTVSKKKKKRPAACAAILAGPGAEAAWPRGSWDRELGSFYGF